MKTMRPGLGCSSVVGVLALHTQSAGAIPGPHNPGAVPPTCNLRGEGHFQLQGGFEVSLTPSPGNKQTNGRENRAVVFTGLCQPMAVLGLTPLPHDL